jgi:hypothetical protein
MVDISPFDEERLEPDKNPWSDEDDIPNTKKTQLQVIHARANRPEGESSIKTMIL